MLNLTIASGYGCIKTYRVGESAAEAGEAVLILRVFIYLYAQDYFRHLS
jgi:hypothetical protein